MEAALLTHTLPATGTIGPLANVWVIPIPPLPPSATGAFSHAGLWSGRSCGRRYSLLDVVERRQKRERGGHAVPAGDGYRYADRDGLGASPAPPIAC